MTEHDPAADATQDGPGYPAHRPGDPSDGCGWPLGYLESMRAATARQTARMTADALAQLPHLIAEAVDYARASGDALAESANAALAARDQRIADLEARVESLTAALHELVGSLNTEVNRALGVVMARVDDVDRKASAPPQPITVSLPPLPEQPSAADVAREVVARMPQPRSTTKRVVRNALGDIEAIIEGDDVDGDAA